MFTSSLVSGGSGNETHETSSRASLRIILLHCTCKYHVSGVRSGSGIRIGIPGTRL